MPPELAGGGPPGGNRPAAGPLPHEKITKMTLNRCFEWVYEVRCQIYERRIFKSLLSHGLSLSTLATRVVTMVATSVVADWLGGGCSPGSGRWWQIRRHGGRIQQSSVRSFVVDACGCWGRGGLLGAASAAAFAFATAEVDVAGTDARGGVREHRLRPPPWLCRSRAVRAPAACLRAGSTLGGRGRAPWPLGGGISVLRPSRPFSPAKAWAA